MSEYFAFQWHITDACDQRCKHCYIYAEDPSRIPESMTLPQMEHVLANCLDFCQTYSRLPYIYLTGGDPILHPDFWTLLTMLKARRIPFAILGNPFHLSTEVCQQLRECGCRKYQLSLDGMRATHDWFRKPGSFDLTLQKIGVLRSAGIHSVIMTTVSGINIDEVPDIMETVAAAQADVYAFARFCPTSAAGETGITPARYRKLMETCAVKCRILAAAGCRTYFSKKDHLWTLYDYETGAFSIPQTARKGFIYDGCNCGNCHLTILPSGNVMACRRLPGSQVGNVFTDSLAGLWVRELEEYRNYDRFEKCSQCELLAWCRGCPAVAGAASGSFYAADPQCWKEITTADRTDNVPADLPGRICSTA